MKLTFNEFGIARGADHNMDLRDIDIALTY